MAPVRELPRQQLASLVLAWLDEGDREAAAELMDLVHDNLVQLCLDLGVLYAGQQATQAIRSALQVANPHAAPVAWKRRNPGVDPSEWETAPAATFQGLCIHALLDNAGVAPERQRGSTMPVPHRAALRLQRADVHDLDDVADWTGLDPDVVWRLWDGEPVGARGVEVRRLRPTTRVAAAGGVGAFASIGNLAAAAASVSAVAVAATAVAIGVAASTLAVQRAPQAPAPVVQQGEQSPPTTTVLPAGSQDEGVEAPLLPGDDRPGLNSPTAPVPTVVLDEDGRTVELPTVPVPDATPSLEGDLPVDVPTDAPPVPVPVPTPTLPDVELPDPEVGVLDATDAELPVEVPVP